MYSEFKAVSGALADGAKAGSGARDVGSGRSERADARVLNPACRTVAEALAREAMKSYARAVRHVARRDFVDIAEDAVQEAMLHLVRRAADPTFVPPVVMRAWLFRWSVCSAFVLRRHGGRVDYVTFDDEVEAYAHQSAEFAERDEADAPDRGLLAEVEERARVDWCDRIERARAEFRPLDRETFDVEVARVDQREPAPPRHRKRLERARPRARRVFSRHGLICSEVPGDVSTRCSPRHNR